MSSDGNLVSKEDHEMNYILQKWNKKQSKDNREILVNSLEEFKKDEEYKPHNRESFYKYSEDKKTPGKLEDAEIKSEKIETKKVEKAEEKKPLKVTAEGKIIKIKLIKSTVGFKKNQIGTVRALGLRRINQIREVKYNAVTQGMIFKVKHLIEILK